MEITILSLGDGSVSSLTLGALKALGGPGPNILQTGKVECARYLCEQGFEFETLDCLYDSAADFDELSRLCAKRVLEAGGVFAVLGDVCVNSLAEAVCEGARGQGRAVRMLCPQSPAMGAISAAGAFTGSGLFIIPAASLGQTLLDTSCTLCVTEIDSRLRASDVALYLCNLYGDEKPSVLLTGGEAQTITLSELPRFKSFDYSSTLVIAPESFLYKRKYLYADLVRVMDRLRGPGGCPWDLEQTHKSLKRYLVEESYEVLSAVDEGDMDKLYDELGDVLLQVVFHSKIAKDAGEFDHTDVTSAVCRKMINRHPHIFGAASAKTPDDVLKNWDAIKRVEKGFTTFGETLRDVPTSMPALMRSYKVQKRAAKAGFDWEDALAAAEKIAEERDELLKAAGGSGNIEEEAGDLLFAVVNVIRKLKIDPELALNAACDKFIMRFCEAERLAEKEGKKLNKMDINELDRLWRHAKQL